MAYWWLWACGAYVLGAVPFGLLIGLARGVDIRQSGSGNTGATNAGRVLGKKWGLICLVLDMCKGAGPVLAAGAVFGLLGEADPAPPDAWRWLAVGLAAVLGHVFSVFLKFKGGKGVATTLGAMLAYWPVLTVPVLVAIATWLLAVAVFRYASLASMAAAVAIPIYIWVGTILTAQEAARVLPFIVGTAGLAALVIVRHRSNIGRLIKGIEPRLGAKKRRSR